MLDTVSRETYAAFIRTLPRDASRAIEASNMAAMQWYDADDSLIAQSIYVPNAAPVYQVHVDHINYTRPLVDAMMLGSTWRAPRR